MILLEFLSILKIQTFNKNFVYKNVKQQSKTTPQTRSICQRGFSKTKNSCNQGHRNNNCFNNRLIFGFFN